MAIAPFAAAAAVALLLFRPRAERGVAIGEYVASVSGHVDAVRAARPDDDATLDALPGSVEEVIVRPREATGAKVAASVLVVRGGIAAPTELPLEVSPLGAVRFDMPGDLLLGASEVRVVVAEPEHLAAAVRMAAHGDALGTTVGAVVRVPVRAPAEKN